MAKLITTLAAFLAFSSLAFASDDSATGSTVRIVSAGKTVATLVLPRVLPGGTLNVNANRITGRRGEGVRSVTLSGKVSITVVRDGQQLLQVSADEAIIDTPEPARATKQPEAN